MRRTYSPVFRLAFFAVIFAIAGIQQASAQVRVDIALKRALYIVAQFEFLLVTIRNLSGRELELRDEGNRKWFSFQIETADGRLVPPRNPDYQLSPGHRRFRFGN